MANDSDILDAEIIVVDEDGSVEPTEEESNDD
jgi:hypothetical protein